MDQHTPTVNKADVECVIARDFRQDEADQVRAALSAYGIESFHREVDRVHLDILKLAEGRIDRVTQKTDNACCDYRDTMAAAEYPNYLKKIFQIEKLSPDELSRIINADKEQYETWLSGKSK